MTIEIKELVIRAVVNHDPKATRSPQDSDGRERKALIQACVEETLKVLRRSQER